MSNYLKSAQKKLNIQRVNLKATAISVRDDTDLSSLNEEDLLAQDFRMVSKINEVSFTDAENNEFWDYRYFYHLGIRLIFSTEEEESLKNDFRPIIEITAIFEAKYISKIQLSKEEQKAFSKNNVGYHVWPYWREYAQSSAARTGLSPVLEIPVYIMASDDDSND